MAHGDYECCAVCDAKMYYDTEARSKETICSGCVASLAKRGVIVGNVRELIDWMKREQPARVVSVLKAVGLQECYYDNEVDRLFEQLKANDE
jgi:hypothetical protein